MNNNPDVPYGWAMPNDMVQEVKKALNRKPQPTPLDELMDVLSQTANEIADVEPEPGDWVGR